MAGYVFVPYSAHGHVNPVLPVADELVSQGEQVRVIAGARFARSIEEAGAAAIPPAREHVPWSPPRWGPRELATVARLRVRRRSALREVALRCRQEFGTERPDVVVADPMVPSVARIAAALGIPVVWLCTTHARSARLTGMVLVNSLPELQPRRHRFDRRFRFVGPLIGPRDRAEPFTDGPLLLVSPGTVFARTARFFRSIVREFTGSEWTVLIATGSVDVRELGPLPDNVLARGWLPQRALLPSATAFLTHGGMNSTQEALSQGVPLLLAPRNAEQRATARRLVRLGVGAPLTGSVRQQAEWLAVDERTRDALESMRQRMWQRRGAHLATQALLHSVGSGLR